MHTTDASSGNITLALIHNGDHSGESELVLIERLPKGEEKILDKLVVPDGTLVADIAMQLAIHQLERRSGSEDY